MNTKLIIVDGHSSVGKSSVSKLVHQQLKRQGAAYWLHEECEAHPIRQNEFSFGPLDSAEGMERNRAGMLQKWAAFRDSIEKSGKVCVTEGCFLHTYDRYFIHSLWNDDQIIDYCAQVVELIKDLNPVLVLLHRPDLRASLEKAFIARGKWWRDLMLKRDDQHVYFKNHSYVDGNSMFDAIAFEQSQLLAIFDRMQCSKIKTDTSAEQWAQYVHEIITFVGATYQEVVPHPYEMQQYLGTYRWQNGKEEALWDIKYDDIKQCLYTSLFWPYMPMRFVTDKVLELISFPVELHFQQPKNRMQFTVRGNYDWEFNDQVFIRV